MKYLLLGLPLGLLAAPAFGQRVEYSLRATATRAQYDGSTAVAATTVNDANNYLTVPQTQAVNPFGTDQAWLGGLDLRATYVAKFNLLGTFGLGYEGYQTRSNVTGIRYYSTAQGSSQPTLPATAAAATGEVRVYTQAALAFAQVGYRLGGGEHAVAVDVLAGPELGYLTTAHELGEGSGARGSWKSDLSRDNSLENKLGFRLRGDIVFWVKNVGLSGGYSYGFTNHQAVTTGVTSPDAELRIIRGGLTVRFGY